MEKMSMNFLTKISQSHYLNWRRITEKCRRVVVERDMIYVIFAGHVILKQEILINGLIKAKYGVMIAGKD